jgi:hypothetical protein
LTDQYVEGSFVNYQEQLVGIDQNLPSLAGAPDDATVQHLIDLYHAAEPAIESPCVSDDCDWQGQLDALKAASEAFHDASEAAS